MNFLIKKKLRFTIFDNQNKKKFLYNLISDMTSIIEYA